MVVAAPADRRHSTLRARYKRLKRAWAHVGWPSPTQDDIAAALVIVTIAAVVHLIVSRLPGGR